MGRVHDTLVDDDKHVRKVTVAIGDRCLDNKGKRVKQTTYLERPIQKIVLLLETSGDQETPVEEP